MSIAIIGGTAMCEPDPEVGGSFRSMQTPYGYTEMHTYSLEGRQVVFLPRHGQGHRTPPHKINYRANIDALRRLGCRFILATNAVGSLHEAMRPGDFVIPDQFIDFTRGREGTFYDGGDKGVRHIDMTQPYCPELRRVLTVAVEAHGQTVHPAATYCCTEGPRFESPAEIRMFATLGADLVGMTGVPELVLAREVGICYASICVVTNYAAGMTSSPLTEGEVTEVMGQRTELLRQILADAARRISLDTHCAVCQGDEGSSY